MAITQAICSSWKAEMPQGLHDFTNGTGDTFKIALYTSSATLNASTTVFTDTGEVSGTGYSTGGIALTNVTPVLDSTTGVIDFDDATFSGVTLTGIRGALIYNSTNGNRAVCVLDFGGDQSVSAGNFTVQFPAAAAATAILRIA